ncbi:MAG: hypothetical protein L0H79_18865 [Intrasporangium sp.]|uniref:LolA family protein n=1 Tax=Intrasporangium sp. TaxID=1925024 RepID=UPI0026489CC6|nr:hypothetical protein [Intrasporangium sp.]MDN5797789.1 hypothetical protein [Intrasporangium sp.]
MTFFGEHPWTRWVAPVAALGLIGGSAVVTNQQADADPGLPSRTAAQLLADVRSADVAALSGTVVQTVDLGLPQLPGLTGGAGPGGPRAGASDGDSGMSSLATLLTGSHTWRVWLDGPTRQRLALIDGSNETDLIHHGNDLWVWSSADKSAVHRRIPTLMHPLGPGQDTRGPADLSPTVPRTPKEAASRALALIGDDTTVTTSGTASVAGRAAYELVLTPKDSATRVASVRIAIDGRRHIPVRVQVYSTKLANPAFQVGFTSIDFGRPDASIFAFTPPPGTKVTDKGTLTLPVHPSRKGATNPAPAAPGRLQGPTVVGSGWSAVLVGRLPLTAADRGTAGDPRSWLDGIRFSLPRVMGSWGRGRLLEGTLFSVVFTDGGRVAVGAVAPAQLYAALAAT